MENVYIECRNCNTYLKIDKTDCRYICNKCKWEEDIVVISGKGSNKNENKRRK